MHLFDTHCSADWEQVPSTKTELVPLIKSSPSMNDTICCLRLKYGRVGRLWKSTKLQVHSLYYGDLIAEFKNMVKDARAPYFANLVTSSKRNPKILKIFDTINNIVHSEKWHLQYPLPFSLYWKWGPPLIPADISILLSTICRRFLIILHSFSYSGNTGNIGRGM